MTDIFKRLAAPFSPDRVSWRVGSTNNEKTRGLALAYIDARDVMERLDEVVGPENWQDEIHGDGPRTICRIGIRSAPHQDEWIWKTDGAGDTAVESEKGAISDAFKRAAVKWGVGRYLYDIEAPWVEIETVGRTSKIKPSEYAKLRALLGGTSNAQKEQSKGADADPKVERAREEYTRLGKAIKATKNPKQLNELFQVEAEALKLIESVSAVRRKELGTLADQHEQHLMDLASAA